MHKILLRFGVGTWDAPPLPPPSARANLSHWTSLWQWFKRLFFANGIFEKEICFGPACPSPRRASTVLKWAYVLKWIFLVRSTWLNGVFFLCGTGWELGSWDIGHLWVLIEKVALWLSPWAATVCIHSPAPAVGVEVDCLPLATLTKHHKLGGLT